MVLTGAFNKAVECEARSTYACVPWPTSGVTSLWGLGGESQGNKWPECCGFVMLLESLRTSGSSCGTARSTSTPPPLVSSLPSRRGTTSSGFTSNLLAVNAEGTRSLLIRIPSVALNSFLHTKCDWRHTFALCLISCFTDSFRAGDVFARMPEQPFFLSSQCDLPICSGPFFFCFHEVDVRRTSSQPLHVPSGARY